MTSPPCLHDLGLSQLDLTRGDIDCRSPIDGAGLGRVRSATATDVDLALTRAQQAFCALRLIPAPRRGALIRAFGDRLRAHKPALAELVSLECGKIRQEALGEVQEMIDICDFAVGLSRQLYGLTMASERPEHRLMELWHPLGPVAVISAFNFPVAVWSWNVALAIVCGDPVLWKPSEKTPLCALACHKLLDEARSDFPDIPAAASQVLLGGADVGGRLAASPIVALVSATGSCRMGEAVAPVVAKRMGRCLLELGGNNAMVVCPSADLDLCLPSALFSAVGTAGQRCTSLRRLIVHEAVFDEVATRLVRACGDLRLGDPLSEGTLVGPLIDGDAYEAMARALDQAATEGGRLLWGGRRVLHDRLPEAFYVEPALVEMPAQSPVVHRETFAPILYLLRFRDLPEAIALHNLVSQGLSSSLFTTDLREAELFLSAAGSDCGIVNINAGTSGAEIGGAFGGEKATGGGRESGSDAWKNYMRRVTATVNHGSDLPLSQGIRFG